MHLVYDLRMAGRPPMNGVARHALELARRLPALAPEFAFDFLVDHRFDPRLLGDVPGNVRLIPTRAPYLSPAEQVELPLLLRRLRPDLYHSPSLSVPRVWPGPLALTLHDTNQLAFPELYGSVPSLYYRHVLRPAALRARLLFTVSHFAQNELMRRLNLPAGRVRVVYNGVGATFRPQPAALVESFRRRLALPERFVLYVGAALPHKNVAQLLDAFRVLSSDLGLVLCANCSGEQAQALVARAGPNAAARLRLLDPVADEDLPLLYGAARVFCFPSLYEGFGLPPLEAMACGTPVVAARATALPEVLGDAAAFVRPGEVLELAETLARVDADPAFAERLRAAGLARAARFTWDQSAEQIVEAYHSLARGTGLVARELAEQSLTRPHHHLARAPSTTGGAPFATAGAAAPAAAAAGDSASGGAIPGPRGATLKALFCVRANLYQVPGGDAVQILRTRAALEERGVDVTLWSEPQLPARGSFDLAHLFHLTRLDTFVHARGLERERLPFVLSTIYWPTEEFDRQGNVGALRLLHRAIASGPATRAKDAARALLADPAWRRPLTLASAHSARSRMLWLAEHARCLLPNSHAEAEVLERICARGQKAARDARALPIAVVVNAADPPPPTAGVLPAGLPSRFLLCAGRIEPRKNQLALVEALRGFSLPLVLVGGVGPLHRDYYRRLQRAAAAGRDVILLPGKPREALFALYAASEAHIAPAWYETPGLVSLEAAAAGTRVVTTDRGCTLEYFGDGASYLDPGVPSSMRAAVESALARPRTAALRERVLREYTWGRAAEQTLEAYRGVLGPSSAQRPFSSSESIAS